MFLSYPDIITFRVHCANITSSESLPARMLFRMLEFRSSASFSSVSPPKPTPPILAAPISFRVSPPKAPPSSESSARGLFGASKNPSSCPPPASLALGFPRRTRSRRFYSAAVLPRPSWCSFFRASSAHLELGSLFAGKFCSSRVGGSFIQGKFVSKLGSSFIREVCSPKFGCSLIPGKFVHPSWCSLIPGIPSSASSSLVAVYSGKFCSPSWCSLFGQVLNSAPSWLQFIPGKFCFLPRWRSLFRASLCLIQVGAVYSGSLRWLAVYSGKFCSSKLGSGEVLLKLGLFRASSAPPKLVQFIPGKFCSSQVGAVYSGQVLLLPSWCSLFQVLLLVGAVIPGKFCSSSLVQFIPGKFCSSKVGAVYSGKFCFPSWLQFIPGKFCSSGLVQFIPGKFCSSQVGAVYSGQVLLISSWCSLFRAKCLIVLWLFPPLATA
ncbi:hypothetical protein C7M84_005875 [Penaeus vannamei]|uniref:Uncharacterized protein n=1 Tax=Penaeus vannamei TaxID=6689 RepID=A0A423TGT6_PENVA|nr:hypothetical protein C7M84_005875 [Penaeus vannamei]